MKYCNRPFGNTNEMDETIIHNWNKKVKKDDIVYHLGDFMWNGTPTKIKELCSRLNGKKFLIFGNHDDKRQLASSGCFEWTGMLFDTRIGGKDMTLCHYPILRWNKAHHGALMLYGHLHNSSDKTFGDETPFIILKNSMNVGVDVAPDFAPFSIEEVKTYMGNNYAY